MEVISDFIRNSMLLHLMELLNQGCLQLELLLRDQKLESLITKEDWIQVWKLLSLIFIHQSNLITKEIEKFFIEEMDVFTGMQMKKGLLHLMICLKFALNLKNINLRHFKNGLNIQFLNSLKTTVTVQMKMQHTKITILHILSLKKI